jgi:hypothetical protein
MKIIFSFVFIISLNVVYAQNNSVAKIILNDALLFDNINNFEYIDDVKYITKFADSELVYRRNKILDHIDRHISVVSIDTFQSFYKVRVKFNLPFKFQQLENDTFEYVLCENYNKYYRINGFIVSDFFQLENFQLKSLESSKFIKCKKSFKYYSKAKLNSIMPFVISIPEKLRVKYRLKIFSNPICSSSIQQVFDAR